MNIRSTYFLAALSVSSTLLASPADEATVRKALEAKYAAYTKAFTTKNEAFLDGLLTKDYTAKQPGKPPLTRAQTIASFTSLMRSTKDVKWTRTFEKVIVRGKEVVVLLDGHFSGRVFDGQRHGHDLDFVAKNEDTWVRSGDDWKLRHSNLLSSKMTVDGKAVTGK